jgi:hypothetical protein
MIVWVVSYPRSGNTFFRILIHEIYGVPTYSGFMSGDDISDDFEDRNPTGHAALPDKLERALRKVNAAEIKSVLDELDSSNDIYFIKTHNTIEELYHVNHRAILLVRDGRQACVSYGWYFINVKRSFRRCVAWLRLLFRSKEPKGRLMAGAIVVWLQSSLIFCLKLMGFERRIWTYVINKYLALSDRWSRLNAGWLTRPEGKTAIVHFEDLIARPIECLKQAAEDIDIHLTPRQGHVPTFEELNKIHPQFFRSGQTDSWKRDLPPVALQAFTSTNQEWLTKLGYLEGS